MSIQEISSKINAVVCFEAKNTDFSQKLAAYNLYYEERLHQAFDYQTLTQAYFGRWLDFLEQMSFTLFLSRNCLDRWDHHSRRCCTAIFYFEVRHKLCYTAVKLGNGGELVTTIYF